MPEPFKVADYEVEIGTKKLGSIRMAERSLGGIDLPIAIINGARSGPTICVMAGEHPNEYAGIETCIRLSKNVNASEVAGRIVILPIINVPGFLGRSPYVNPIDGVNVATIWPGREKGGSITYVMVHNIFKKVIEAAGIEYLLDLHGGDICESMIPCVYAPKVGDREKDNAALSLAKIFGKAGIEYAVEWVSLKKGEALEELIILLVKRGIPAIIAEAGTGGKVEEEAVALLYNGVLNVMKHLGMVKGEPIGAREPKVVGREGRSSFVGSERGGLLYSFVEVGDMVSEGDALGEIRNIWGETIEKIIAPHKGKIFFKINPLPWDPSLGWFLYNVVDVES